MACTVSNDKNQLLCYDETNPMVFHDEQTAIHWIQQNIQEYKGLPEYQLRMYLTFNDMGLLYNEIKPEKDETTD